MSQNQPDNLSSWGTSTPTHVGAPSNSTRTPQPPAFPASAAQELVLRESVLHGTPQGASNLNARMQTPLSSSLHGQMQASYNHQNAYHYHHQQQQQQQGFNPNYGHEDQENHMLNEFQVLLEDAEPVVEKLALFAQERQSLEIHKRHEDYVPVVQNKIYKLRLEIAEDKRQLKQKEAGVSKLVEGLEHYISPSGLLPFLRSFCVRGNSELSFPHGQPLPLVKKWIEVQIKTLVSHDLKNSNASILQGLFGLHDYSDLNDLSQEQLHLILTTLAGHSYHVERSYKEQMTKYKLDGVIGDTFRMGIYRSGPTHFSENTHRGLCAIYLGILGDKMKTFRFVPWNKPDECPWGEPGDDYRSSHDLQMQREGNSMEVEYPNRLRKRRRAL